MIKTLNSIRAGADPQVPIILKNPGSLAQTRFHAVQLIRHVSLLALGKLCGTGRLVE